MFSYNFQAFPNLEQTSDIWLLSLEFLQIIWQQKSEGVLVIGFCHIFLGRIEGIIIMLPIVSIKM